MDGAAEPMKMTDIDERFSLEQSFYSAFNWLTDLGLLFDFTGPCNLCATGTVHLQDDGGQTQETKRWRCGRSSCRKTWTLRKNSWFEGSRLSIPQILKLTYLWVYESSNRDICKLLNVSPHTVIEWANACREVCLATAVNSSKNGNKLVGGVGRVVEIDVSKFRGCQYRYKLHDLDSKRGATGSWGICGIDLQSNDFFFSITEDNSPATVICVLQKHVKPGTTIISNCSKSDSSLQELGYSGLQELGFIYQPVDPSTDSECENSGHPSTLHMSQYGRRRHFHKSYFTEHVIREHYLKVAPDPFLAFIHLISKVYRHPFRELRPPGVHPSLLDHSYSRDKDSPELTTVVPVEDDDD